MTAKVLTILMQKGGTGKTTTAINIGVGLARAGKKVMLVDLDPQSNTAMGLHLQPNPGSYYLLVMAAGGSPVDPGYIRQYLQCPESYPNLSVLAAHPMLGTVNEMVKASSISMVRNALKPFLRDGLDHIILDTSPTQGGIHEYAAWAADAVIIPAECEHFALSGVMQSLDLLRKLREKLDWKGGVLGILPTKLASRDVDYSGYYQALREKYGDLVLDPIHTAAAFRKCLTAGVSIFDYDPKSRAAEEYGALVRRILKEI
jgi:chromosome partitioning protein